MSGIPCKVKKAFDGFYVDQLVEVSEENLARLERRGRVRRIPDATVDRSRVGAIPPTPDDQAPGQVAPTRRLVIVDNRGKDRNPGEIPPTITFARKKKEQPPVRRPIGPDENQAERVPAVRPTGPDLREPIGPEETKEKERVEAVQQNAFWWHVLVDGKPLAKTDGTPQNFRHADALKVTADLLLDEEF